MLGITVLKNSKGRGWKQPIKANKQKSIYTNITFLWSDCLLHTIRKWLKEKGTFLPLLPGNLQSSFGTISTEHSSWNPHTPEPGLPGGPFSPHWTREEGRRNKYIWNIFNSYRCVNNICMTKQNGSTEHDHKPSRIRFWSLHLVFSFTWGKFRWCHCTWRAEKTESVDMRCCVLTKHFCYYFHQLYSYNFQVISTWYIENQDLGVKLKKTA